MRFCEECGAQLPDDVKFCEECGAVVEELVVEEKVENTEVNIQDDKTVNKPVKSGKPMKKGLLLGIIGAVVVVILAVVLIFALGGDKEDESESKKNTKDEQVEENSKENVDSEEESEEAVKENSSDNTTSEEQEEKVSIFDVGFGGEFSGGTYTVECDDGFSMYLSVSPMASYGSIHSADWSWYASFDLYEDICFDTEYTMYSTGVDEYGDSYTHEITYTVQKDGIWIYWCHYGYRGYETVFFDGFVSADNITCTSSYTEYEWGLKAIQENPTTLADRDSKYAFKRIDGGEVQSISFNSGYWEEEFISLSKYMDEEDITYTSIQNADWDYVYFSTDTPIYYGEEFVYMGECFEGPEDYYWEELDYTIQENGEKVYDTSKYDNYTEVRILVNDAGIDVYWCDHNNGGTTVLYDGLFEAEWVERTTYIKNY